MKNRRAWWAAAIMSGVIVALLLVSTNRQPRFEGKRLGRWLEEINRAGSLSNAEPALKAIVALGTNSLPFLLEIISIQNSPAKEKFIWYMEKASLPVLELPFAAYLKGASCLALKTLGTNADPIIPELAALALLPEHMSWAISALFAIGSTAAPGFITVCGSSNVMIRAESALYLSKVADGSQRGAHWEWGSTAPGRRQFSYLASTIGSEEDARAIVRQLKHPNAAVRRASVEALTVFCHQHKFILEELAKAQEDKNDLVRIAASEAIANINAN